MRFQRAVWLTLDSGGGDGDMVVVARLMRGGAMMV